MKSSLDHVTSRDTMLFMDYELLFGSIDSLRLYIRNVNFHFSSIDSLKLYIRNVNVSFQFYRFIKTLPQKCEYFILSSMYSKSKYLPVMLKNGTALEFMWRLGNLYFSHCIVPVRL